jgi:hypothetical protein
MKIIVLALLAIYVTTGFVNPSDSYNMATFNDKREVGKQQIFDDAGIGVPMEYFYFYSNAKGEPRLILIDDNINKIKFVNPLNGEVFNEYYVGSYASLYIKNYFYKGQNFIFILHIFTKVLHVFREEVLIGSFGTLELGDHASIAVYNHIIILSSGKGREQTLYFRDDGQVDGTDYYTIESNFTYIETVVNKGKQYIVDRNTFYDSKIEPRFFQNITIWNIDEQGNYVKVHSFEMIPESHYLYLDEALFIAYRGTVYRYGMDGTIKSIELEGSGNFNNIGRMNEKTFIVGTDFRQLYIIDTVLKAVKKVDYSVSAAAYEIALFEKYLLLGRYYNYVPRKFETETLGDVIIYELENENNLFSFLE